LELIHNELRHGTIHNRKDMCRGIMQGVIQIENPHPALLMTHDG